jgi:hypothetical protein
VDFNRCVSRSPSPALLTERWIGNSVREARMLRISHASFSLSSSFNLVCGRPVELEQYS